MKRILPGLILIASLAALARAPRFLGPPVKKPADAGTADAGSDDAGSGSTAPSTRRKWARPR